MSKDVFKPLMPLKTFMETIPVEIMITVKDNNVTTVRKANQEDEEKKEDNSEDDEKKDNIEHDEENKGEDNSDDDEKKDDNSEHDEEN